MDGLAYYRLKQLPVKKSQKPKVQSQQPIDKTGVEYLCANCGKPNIVSARSDIQCRYCDWRILDKGRTLSVTLKAV